MKYALFACETYYPCGGWNDLFGVYETFKKAHSQYKKLKRKSKYDYFQIVNLETGTVRLNTDKYHINNPC
jgi:hypothetical protein